MPYSDPADRRAAERKRDWLRKGYQIVGEEVRDPDGNMIARWTEPVRQTAPHRPPIDHDYITGESGHTLKGVSLNTDGQGNENERWTKTTRAGRDDRDVVHLPEPRVFSKVATNYDADGKVTQQWVTEKPLDRDKELLWQTIADNLVARIDAAKALPPIPPPRHVLAENLLACYPVGDHHFGMLSWSKETGASYDLDIGRDLLARATDELMTRIRPCRQALIAVLGDLFHYDSFEPVTPTSRNMLDSDGRYPKMVDVALDGVMRMIDRALLVHGLVHVIIEVGNHDLSTSVFLARALARIYRDNSRVTIDTSPRHFHYYEFGKNLIQTHHGHGVKMAELPMVMASDMPEAWGRTTHRYSWTGHIHHAKTVTFISGADFRTVSVESFRVLAPTDSWAANKGFRSLRDMKAIEIDRDFGEVGRSTVKPEMLANDNERGRIAA